MKKRTQRALSLLLTFCIVITALPISGMTAFANKGVTYGDADSNQHIDLQDVNLIERYIDGETEAKSTINKANADVNADGQIDDEDVWLLKEYLVGNIQLSPELCTITFNTDGGSALKPITTGIGYTYKGDIPTPTKDGFVFVNWEKEDGSAYYPSEDVITGNMTLKAAYAAVEPNQKLQITSFSLVNQPENVSFDIVGDSKDAVESNITVLSKDGSAPVEIKVEPNSNGNFTVYAPNGFKAGATYELTLGDGLTFAGKDKMFRTVSFIIKKEERDDIKFNADVIFIKDTDQMNYTIGGNTIPVLEATLLSNDKSNDAVTGTFTMPGGSLKKEDIVCIYENIHPNDRDYTKNNYEDDALAYVRITDVNGVICSFESLNENDAEQVLAMPDSIPYQVDVLPTTDGTVDINSYAADVRAQLGQTKAPSFEINDFLVFFTGSFEEAKQGTKTAYGQVTRVDGSTVYYKIVTKEAVEDFMGMFVSQEIDAETILEEIDQKKVLNDVKQQAENSGFVEQATEQMVKSALETEDVQNKLLKNGITNKEIRQMAAAPVSAAGTGGTAGGSRAKLSVESTSVTPTFVKGNHFKNGVGVKLDICVVMSVDKTDSPSDSNIQETISLKIELSASFEQEVSLGVNVDVDDKWKWYGPFPVLKDLYVTTSVDIQSYSAISVGAKIYTVSDEAVGEKWQSLSNTITGPNANPKYRALVSKIDALGQKVIELRKKGEDVQDILDQIDLYMGMLPKVIVDGKEYTYKELLAELDAEDATSSFEKITNAQDKSEAKTGINQLIDRYKEMLEQECDWVEIYNKSIFEKELHIKVVAIKLSLDFVVNANVNVAIGADIEYEVGKRYTFWIHIRDAKSGSSETDLIDERFGFQFYVMGTLGLKVGVRAEITMGIISTKIASIGASVEFGPYLKLWGYFVYNYERLRPANSNARKELEEMLGAMYVDFGLYLTVNFKVQAFGSAIKYESTLYDKEFSLLTAGAKQNVYDFALQPDEEDILYIDDEDNNQVNGVTMDLPQWYRNMKTLDLRSGEKSQTVYPLDKFIVTFSDSKFSIDKKGKISVKVPDDIRYLKCDMRIVWKCDKLAFSVFDTDITVPVVWTNMTDKERNEKFTVNVAVGDSKNGYKTVWSDRFTKIDVFDLPSQEEILELIDYDKFNNNDTNLKYKDVGQYREKSTGLSVTTDKTYYYDITPKIYKLTVNGIQGYEEGKTSETYEAVYGESFNLQNLQSTGIDNDDTNEYTSFSKLMDENGETVNGEIFVNLDFANKYSKESAIFTAIYSDEAITATFTFVGLNKVEPVEIKFRRGTTPPFGKVQEYVAKKGGENATIMSTTPSVEQEVESSTLYTVNCDIPEKAKPKHTLSFETNGGNTIKEQLYQEGSVIFRPTNPKRTGYTFEGWYEDTNLKNLFDFDKRMPSEDVTAYAKWKPNTYKVSFDTGDYAEAPEAISVTYGKAYGTDLPVSENNDYKFLGWYTDKTDGTKIEAATIFNKTTDQTLYARWELKAEIPSEWITCDGQNICNYDEKEKTFGFTVTAPNEEFKAEAEAIENSIIVEYQKKGDADWTKNKPVNAGTYDVQLTRTTDNNYKAYNKFIPSAIIINKLDLAVGKPTVFKDYGTVRVCLSENIKSDGEVTYKLQSSENLYENSTGIFYNVPAGNYSAIINIAEGTNYNGKSTQSACVVDGIKPGPFTASLTFDTIESTDTNICGSVYFHENPSYDFNLIHPGMYSGSDVFEVSNGIVPWQIIGGFIAEDDPYDIVTQFRTWEFESWFNFENPANNKNFEVPFMSGSIADQSDPEVSWDYRLFRRKITDDDAGNFKTAGEYDSNSGTYKFSYDGLLTDQFMGEYNAMQYFDAPIVNVTSGNSIYDEYITYTGVNAFEIDVNAVKNAYLAESIKGNVTEPIFTVTLECLWETILEKPTRKIDIREYMDIGVLIDPPVAPAALSGGVLKSAPATMTVKNNQNTLLTTAMTLPAEDVFVNRGRTFDVDVNIEEDTPIWGLLADIGFDNDVLELTGYTFGDVFTKEQFVMQKDMSKSSYKFLATLDNIDTKCAKGKIITLRFKVKENAEDKATKISFNSLEAVDKTSDVKIEHRQAVNIQVDSKAPVISGIIDGGVYYANKVSVEITEENLESVTLNGKNVNLTKSKFTLYPAKEKQTVVVTDKAGNIVTATVTVNKRNWKLSADVTNYAFEERHIGYNNAPSAQSFTVSNTGNQKVTNIKAVLSGNNAECFTLSANAMESSVKVKGTTSLSVQPKPGLMPGEYTATVNITGDKKAAAAVNVYFKVSDHAWENYKYNKDATYYADGTETAVCFADGCKEKHTRTKQGSMLKDNTAPLGEIKVDKNGWKAFLNTITFGLFCKDKFDVTITAEDDETGIANVRYYISETAISEKDIVNVSDWKAYSELSLEDKGNIVYAKITDNSNNITYVGSDGTVIKKTNPSVNGFADGGTYCSAVKVTVLEQRLVSVRLNGKRVTLTDDNKFTVKPADGVQTIVVTNKTGQKTTYTLTVNDYHTFIDYKPNNDADGTETAKCEYCDAERTRNQGTENKNYTLTVWLIVLLITAAALIIVLVIKRKRRNEEK